MLHQIVDRQDAVDKNELLQILIENEGKRRRFFDHHLLKDVNLKHGNRKNLNGE